VNHKRKTQKWGKEGRQVNLRQKYEEGDSTKVKLGGAIEARVTVRRFEFS